MSVMDVLGYMEHATARVPESEGDERITPALCLCQPPTYLLARSGAPPAARTGKFSPEGRGKSERSQGRSVQHTFYA